VLLLVPGLLLSFQPLLIRALQPPALPFGLRLSSPPRKMRSFSPPLLLRWSHSSQLLQLLKLNSKGFVVLVRDSNDVGQMFDEKRTYSIQ